MSYLLLRKMLLDAADDKQAEILKRFFRTGKCQYGEGDDFLGIKVPVNRKIVKNNLDLNTNELGLLLRSKYHEERLAALFVIVEKYSRASETEKEEIFDFYMNNRKGINNWDLVDLSAPAVVGAYLYNKDKSVLFEFAKSRSLWDRRIAVISTFYFIKKGEFDVTLQIAEILLKDKHDLIHKAVGWMLREIGKRDLRTEESFLEKYYKVMPRTMLRYAIEKFPQRKRQRYLKGKI